MVVQDAIRRHHTPRNPGNSRTKNDPGLEPGSWGGSSHSLCSPALSRGSSPHRRGMDSQHFRRVSEKARSPSPEYRRSSRRERSTTRRVQGHTSSQSSLESEVCNVSGGTDVTGLMEEYVVMADIPKTKPIHMREGPRLRGRSQSHRIEEVEPHQSRRYSYTTDVDSRERGRGRERGRDRREKREHGRHGRQSEAQTTASYPSLRSSHPAEEDIPPLDALRPSGHTQTQSAPEIDRRAGSLPSPYPADLSGDTHSEKACSPCFEITDRHVFLW
ncbi:hypothetical protein GJAV_G00143530 [Gymnothorax javanicus]|nr:hypothetical protein GJAV_G00143530 [Gymnothorax javanicus]